MFSSCRPQKACTGKGRPCTDRQRSFDEEDVIPVAYPPAPRAPKQNLAGAGRIDVIDTESPEKIGGCVKVCNGVSPDKIGGCIKGGRLLSSCAPSMTACKIDRALSAEGHMLMDEDNVRYVPTDNAETTVAPGVSASDEETPYTRLVDDSDDEPDVEAKLTREIVGIREHVKCLRAVVTGLVLTLVSVGISIEAYFFYGTLSLPHQAQAREWLLLASIPIVAMLFTWFHIWLAIQMMFRPLEFVGCCQIGTTGMGIGWQGVVPRKCHKMAKTAYSSARPYLDGPRDWLERVDSRDLVAKIRPELSQVIEEALGKVGQTYAPVSDRLLPDVVRRRITDLAVNRIQETSPALWTQIMNLLCDDAIGIDNDGMIVKVFTENKELLNEFFMRLGAKEFRFIEHCGAAMGFICGVVQLVAFNNLGPEGRAVFLPVTGFFLGIVTNWLAILMVFKPAFPVPVRLCGWHLCDIQGLFLKRQKDVAVQYSKMLCENFLAFNKVVPYLQELPDLWPKLKEAYVAHTTRVLRETLGFAATWLAPMALGQNTYEMLEEDLKHALVVGLYKAESIHSIAGKYIGKVTRIEQNNLVALQTMPPNEFEDLLHPVFKEDEWILILLGGVLGMIVGLAQVYFLS